MQFQAGVVSQSAAWLAFVKRRELRLFFVSPGGGRAGWGCVCGSAGVDAFIKRPAGEVSSFSILRQGDNGLSGLCSLSLMCSVEISGDMSPNWRYKLKLIENWR
jgi:hypothetical protein